ncbi:MAG: hypothetical protein KAT61_01760 [Gammaproteobacteria bacterium]|nr:hypothetical protein [Gammaproteobacteria bacterium]
MLLHCHYTGDENNIDQLHIEHLVEDNWQELDLNTSTPGFDIFMYAILTCQHTYFRVNAAKYGLILDSSEGLITVMADKHHSIETLNVKFKGKLKNGSVTKEAVDSIVARMGLCPVSINLKDIPHSKITASFDAS